MESDFRGPLTPFMCGHHIRNAPVKNCQVTVAGRVRRLAAGGFDVFANTKADQNELEIGQEGS